MSTCKYTNYTQNSNLTYTPAGCSITYDSTFSPTLPAYGYSKLSKYSSDVSYEPVIGTPTTKGIVSFPMAKSQCAKNSKNSGLERPSYPVTYSTNGSANAFTVWNPQINMFLSNFSTTTGADGNSSILYSASDFGCNSGSVASLGNTSKYPVLGMYTYTGQVASTGFTYGEANSSQQVTFNPLTTADNTGGTMSYTDTFYIQLGSNYVNYSPSNKGFYLSPGTGCVFTVFPANYKGAITTIPYGSSSAPSTVYMGDDIVFGVLGDLTSGTSTTLTYNAANCSLLIVDLQAQNLNKVVTTCVPSSATQSYTPGITTAVGTSPFKATVLTTTISLSNPMKQVGLLTSFRIYNTYGSLLKTGLTVDGYFNNCTTGTGTVNVNCKQFLSKVCNTSTYKGTKECAPYITATTAATSMWEYIGEFIGIFLLILIIVVVIIVSMVVLKKVVFNKKGNYNGL